MHGALIQEHEHDRAVEAVYNAAKGMDYQSILNAIGINPTTEELDDIISHGLFMIVAETNDKILDKVFKDQRKT